MAEVTIARTGQLLRQLLEIIMRHPDGMQAQDALFELRKNVVLTPY